MYSPSNLRNNLLFSTITLSLVMLSEYSIASEGRIPAATQQNVPPPNVDNPGKINNFLSFYDIHNHYTYRLYKNIHLI